MSSRFDFDAPAFRPAPKDTGGNGRSQKPRTPRGNGGRSVGNSPRVAASNNPSKRASANTANNMARSSHEQRISAAKSGGSRNRRGSNNQNASPYDTLCSGSHAPDKLTFVNTNCRFVVDSTCDLHQICSDPNTKVPVNHVLRILCQPLACPICLEQVPEAPRMLECGHIMCFPCLLRYQFADTESKDNNHDLKSRERPYKECPLCFEEVRLEKAKPVTFQNHDLDTPVVGHESVLRLMFRPLGSLLATPVDMANQLPKTVFTSDRLIPVVNHEASIFSRVVLGTADYAIGQLVNEIKLLKESKDNNMAYFDDDGICYDESISLIKDEIRFLSERNATEQNLASQVASLTVSDSLNTSSYADHDAYYFYQTGFGLPTKYFLAPLDVKILRQAFGDFSSFPPFLILKIQHIEYGKYTNDDLTKRIKYMGHIPTHTSIAFLECDWKGTISEDVLVQFAGELNKRRKRKQDQQRKEDRDKIRFQKLEENKILADSEYSLPYVIHESAAEEVNLSDYSYSSPALPSQESFDTISHTSRKTVWGTHAVSFSTEEDSPREEQQDEITQILENAQQAPKHKGRKKLVLYTSRA